MSRTPLLVRCACGSILASCMWLATAVAQENLQDQPLGETTKQEVKWPPKGVREIDVDPSPNSDKIPPDSANELVGSASPDHWFNSAYAYQTKAWYPPSIVYNPLYFEDPFLERDGDAVFRRPLLESSRGAARLGTQILVLPFNLFVAPPHACEAPPAVDQRGQAQVSRPAILYGR